MLIGNNRGIVMKIAVCFFGHLRTFKKCAPHIKTNLINRYDCDLFMHTWSTYNHHTKTHHENTEIKGIVKESEIIDTYGEFKSIKIEEQVVQDLGNVKVSTKNKRVSLYGVEVSMFGLYSMYHSMKNSFSLCKEYASINNIQYDMVVMIRPDIVLLDPLNIELYESCAPEETLDKSLFTFAKDLSEVNIRYFNLGGNDLMFFGKLPVIESIMNGSIQELKRIESSLEVTMPEHIIFNIANQQKLDTYIINYPGWTLIRPMSFKSKLSRIVRFKLHRNFLKIEFLVFILYKLFSIRLSIGNFEINICAGRPYSD